MSKKENSQSTNDWYAAVVKLDALVNRNILLSCFTGEGIDDNGKPVWCGNPCYG